MTQRKILNKLNAILDEAGTAVLATEDSEGNARMRWMTPVILAHQPRTIFCIAAKSSAKVQQLTWNRNVQWMFQRRDLSEIINIQGFAGIVDNPALKTELIDILGPRLGVFWKANAEPEEFVVLETIIQETTYFKPLHGKKDTVSFTQEVQL